MPQTILGSYRGEWFTASTPEQGRLLSDPVALRHLKPFIGRTLGAGAAAREAGVTVERMLYRVRQFVRVGLLRPAGEERRAGRPVRLFRAPGGLRVPFALTPFADLEAQVARHSRPYDQFRARVAGRRLQRLDHHARLIYRDEQGEVNSETDAPELQGQLSRDYTGIVWLDETDARRLSRLIDEVRTLMRHGEMDHPGQQPYLIQAVLLALELGELDEFQGPPG
ncbi:hypothetical protein [Deinococcus aerophilus]|uniref:Uncharacterized protein n=1 Tax=Deinococcus aerophilus TaxID=522488 RepID=A0ABQ2GWZ4_9DEIO|nr:hypothetical protein [Deinococcus aerophilus]GGM15878.1 hypothetical protein GCM10010841_25340 [Deinococcus aerophilus]